MIYIYIYIFIYIYNYNYRRRIKNWVAYVDIIRSHHIYIHIIYMEYIYIYIYELYMTSCCSDESSCKSCSMLDRWLSSTLIIALLGIRKENVHASYQCKLYEYFIYIWVFYLYMSISFIYEYFIYIWVFYLYMSVSFIYEYFIYIWVFNRLIST